MGRGEGRAAREVCTEAGEIRRVHAQPCSGAYMWRASAKLVATKWEGKHARGLPIINTLVHRLQRQLSLGLKDAVGLHCARAKSKWISWFGLISRHLPSQIWSLPGGKHIFLESSRLCLTETNKILYWAHFYLLSPPRGFRTHSFELSNIWPLYQTSQMKLLRDTVQWSLTYFFFS